VNIASASDMADSIIFAVGVWIAVQVPLALLIGAIIRCGRGWDPMDGEVNPDIAAVRAA
jgi:hypothetical protein